MDEFIATTYLRSSTLHLDYAREVVGYKIRYEFYPNNLAIAVVGGGTGQGCLNLLPTASIRAEGIA